MRDQIIAGNWKMNKDWDQGVSLVAEIQKMMLEESSDETKVVVASPYIHLARISEMVTQSDGLYLAAQNCHHESAGAYTGEISASMLRSIGVEYVIIGHSERREYFKESHELLASKVKAVLDHDLIPIFCCGEPLSIRESNQQGSFVNQQLSDSLFQLTPESIRRMVIAYEPIWAIGTGRTASAAQAQEMHHSIRQHLAGQYGKEISDEVPILYGGSCKPANAEEIFAGPDVDGGLIGGASLNASDFMAIVRSL
jgi:triosephosphate isomerase